MKMAVAALNKKTLSAYLNQLVLKYQKWVSSNPQSTTDIESAVKWISYLLTSRYNDSNVISEFIFTISNLMILFNDRIIYKSLPNSAASDRYKNYLKMVLTVLEHAEVFIEISANKLWGNRGKWTIVTCIQLFKSISRLRLLYAYNIPIIEHPLIPFLNRRNLSAVYEEINNSNVAKHKGFPLKSGRVIRSLENVDSVNNRSWQAIQLREINPSQDKELNNHQIIAETMYIIKPLVHLGSIYYFGRKSWKPWVFALSMDCTSLYLMKKEDSRLFSKRQQVEIVRRHLCLLMYLMRSPFYDRKSKNQISRVLQKLSDLIPFIHFILEPISEYIPHWQQTYFYMWST